MNLRSLEEDCILLFFEKVLHVFELVSSNVVVVDDFQIFGVFVVLSTTGLLLLGTVVLDVGSQNPHFLMKVIRVVKVIELGQT